ncbi:MAG: NUDIX domain-containing protein [Christensenellaceae bacterium]|nr:NUDIX domain-containing protein [Christensenellaceae bacterium]
MNDICFEFNNKCFIYRVGAIIIRNNKLLMATNPNVTFYYTVGGRVLFGESSQEALLREVREEIGIELEIDRLAFINESYYRIYENKKMAHEIALYYIMKDNDTLDDIAMNYKDGTYNNTLKWFNIKDLNKQYIYPEFLKYELLNLSNGIKHIITIE